MDLHPVAVTLARVTYLLAIGSDRLMHPDRGPIQVPVFLGDAVQSRASGAPKLTLLPRPTQIAVVAW